MNTYFVMNNSLLPICLWYLIYMSGVFFLFFPLLKHLPEKETKIAQNMKKIHIADDLVPVRFPHKILRLCWYRYAILFAGSCLWNMSASQQAGSCGDKRYLGPHKKLIIFRKKLLLQKLSRVLHFRRLQLLAIWQHCSQSYCCSCLITCYLFNKTLRVRDFFSIFLICFMFWCFEFECSFWKGYY